MSEMCPCPDFEAVDDDGDECACGHVQDEHEDGFFRACTVEFQEDGDV